MNVDATESVPSPPSTMIPRSRALSGFPTTMGLTLVWVGLIVVLPLSTIFYKAREAGGPGFWAIATTPRVLAAYRLTLTSAGAAATINAVFGFVVAWVLVRYRFPGRKLFDAMVDLPVALPTAVAGIALTALYTTHGWIGAWCNLLGIRVAYTPLGIIVALTFIGLPFVVRTVQPVLENLEAEIEEAAATLGASRLETFRRVLLPAIWPALLTGFALAFARGIGEYGSVVFIAGNTPMRTEIVPLLIMTKLDQFDYAGASVVATVMLLLSFTLLLVINTLQARLRGKGT